MDRRSEQMGPEQLEGFRQMLLDERERQRRFIQNLEEAGLDMAETESVGELSSYDQHTADQGTETFAREQDQGLRVNAREILDRVDAALARIDDGTYGVCETCGRAIPKERLKAIPYATECVECATERGEDEGKGHRPVEEESLAPAFGRTFDDETDRTAFDGEDAWQSVARYGTANSPQDVPDAKDFDDAYVDADEDRGMVERVESVTGGAEPGGGDGDDAALADMQTKKRRDHRPGEDAEDSEVVEDDPLR